MVSVRYKAGLTVIALTVLLAVYRPVAAQEESFTDGGYGRFSLGMPVDALKKLLTDRGLTIEEQADRIRATTSKESRSAFEFFIKHDRLFALIIYLPDESAWRRFVQTLAATGWPSSVQSSASLINGRRSSSQRRIYVNQKMRVELVSQISGEAHSFWCAISPPRARVSPRPPATSRPGQAPQVEKPARKTKPPIIGTL